MCDVELDTIRQRYISQRSISIDTSLLINNGPFKRNCFDK